MSHTKQLFVLAGAAVGLSSVAALADQPSVNRDEVRAIVAEMLNDADSRSSLLQGSGNAGYDKKFFLASSDNNYRLNIGGYGQFRYTGAFQTNDNNNVTNDLQTGFSFRNARLEFSGHVINPDLKYFLSFDLADQQDEISAVTFDSNIPLVTSTFVSRNRTVLKDFFADYSFGGGWYLRGGQYKLPFLKEELVADTMQLAADRGFVNSVFTGERSQGVGLGYRDETFRWAADFSDGFNAKNTVFSNNGQIINGIADYAFTTRFDWAFAGKLDDWKQYTSMQDDEFKGYVGAAFHWQGTQNDQDANGAGGAGFGFDLSAVDPQRYLSFTVDAGVKSGGFSLIAAFVGSNTEFRNGFTAGNNIRYSDFTDFGVNVQGGWRFAKDDEIFARWDGLFYDKDRTNTVAGVASGDQSNFNFLTVGWNHYFAGQAARLTVDAVIALDTTIESNGMTVRNVSVNGGNSPFGNNQGIFASPNNGAVAIRAQFQLMF
jgi:hypothetical protein